MPKSRATFRTVHQSTTYSRPSGTDRIGRTRHGQKFAGFNANVEMQPLCKAPCRIYDIKNGAVIRDVFKERGNRQALAVSLEIFRRLRSNLGKAAFELT